MKKSMIISSFLALLLMLSACAPNNDNNEDNHNQSNGVNAPKHAKNLTENDIFTSNKSHQKLTEDEMNQAIKKYLDVRLALIICQIFFFFWNYKTVFSLNQDFLFRLFFFGAYLLYSTEQKF